MLSTKQQEYLNNCNHRWNLKVGATGSGKSWLDYAVVIPQRLLALKGQGAVVILGNTQGTADRNILEPMREMWGKRLVGTIRGNNAAMLFGKKVYVMGADNVKHVDRIRGMTIEYAYGDEITTWNEEVFQMLKSRLRCEHSAFDGTANPTAPSNYVKRFIDSNADIYCQTSTIDDNPFLPKDVVANLKMEYEGTVYYRRYILGEWALAEGLIYPMYEFALEDTTLTECSDWVLSVDYGTQNAFSAGLWGRTNDGVWHRTKEYYYSGRDSGTQKTDEEYAQDMDDFTAEVRSKTQGRLKVIIDPSAASFIATLRRRQHYKVIQADNAVADGIRDTATAMKLGLIKISKRCDNWIKEAQGYTWDERSGEDKPIKENDHAMDDTRYLVKTLRLITKHGRTYTPIWN